MPPGPLGGVGGALVFPPDIISSILRIIEADSTADSIACSLTLSGSITPFLYILTIACMVQTICHIKLHLENISIVGCPFDLVLAEKI